MTTGTSSIRDASFCHDVSQLTAALDKLNASEPGKLLILAGPAGSGRRRVLEWLAERSGARVVPLDLDGFEPTGPGVARFVEFRSAFGREREDEEERAAQLVKLVERVHALPAAASSGRWAAAFALTLELPDERAFCAELLALEDAQLTPERMLTGALERLSADTPLIVHVPSESTLSDPTLEWFVARTREHARVRLAFSCASQLASEALVPAAREGLAPLRIELGGQCTREQLEARLASRGVPESERAALCEASGGSVARLGRALEAQLTAADSAPARLNAWLESCGEDGPRLRAVLQLCAACGEAAPILPLLAASNMSQADAERFIDIIDEGLCGPEAPLPMFDDLAYRHPGFPGLSVYRFRDPGLRHALLDTADPKAERALLEFLSTRMSLGTRSVTQLFLNLVERAQFDASAAPRQRLRLWIGPAEQAALQALLRKEVETKRLNADALFTTAQRDQSMTVFQRLALLEASVDDESKLPPDRRLVFNALHAELLVATGSFQAALATAERATELLAQQPSEPAGMRGLLMFLTANCQRQLGRFDVAAESFKAAAAEAGKPRPDGKVDFHNQGVCLAEAGHCHAERGEWQAAVALLTEGIALLKRPDNEQKVPPEQLTQLERNLSVCRAKLQEPATPG